MIATIPGIEIAIPIFPVPVANSEQKNGQVWSYGRLNVGFEEIEPIERE